MKTLFFLLLIGVLIGIAIDFVKINKQKGGGRRPFKQSDLRQKPISDDTWAHKRTQTPYFGKIPLTDPEQVLFHRLREALPNEIVLAQVAMSALVGIRKNPAWQTQFNEISRKYVDFVVCRRDFTVAAVVELDDASHIASDRIKADVVKDAAFQIAKCQVIRFHVREMPSVEQIRLAIAL